MIDLEHVVTGDGIERNFAKLRSLVPDTGGQSVGVRFGRLTLTWPGGSPESDILTLTHGLTIAPYLQLTPTTRVGAVAIIAWSSTPGATTVLVRGRTVDGSNPAAAATATVDWLAIG